MCVSGFARSKRVILQASISRRSGQGGGTNRRCSLLCSTMVRLLCVRHDLEHALRRSAAHCAVGYAGVHPVSVCPASCEPGCDCQRCAEGSLVEETHIQPCRHRIPTEEIAEQLYHRRVQDSRNDASLSDVVISLETVVNGDCRTIGVPAPHTTYLQPIGVL